MNAAQLSAWVAKNKVAVLGVAGVGAVGLGLRSRKNKAAGDDGLARDTALTTGPAIAGTVPYDSSAVDAYNALMPAIEKLYRLQEESQRGDTGSPIPLPTQPATPAPTYAPATPVYANQIQGDFNGPQYPDVTYSRTGPNSLTADPLTFTMGRTNYSGQPIADQAINQWAGYHTPESLAALGMG